MKKFLVLLLFLVVSIPYSNAQQAWSWKFPLPQGLDVYQILFTSPDTGYAVADNGTFLKTYDGGVTWIITYNDSCHFKSIFFTDNNTGFMGGLTMSSIFKTTDAGNTWIPLFVDLFFQFPPNYIVKEIYFKDSLTGFLNGGEYYTTDGGVTWNSSSKIGDHIHFIDTNSGFALQSSIVKKTFDGGLTWQNVGTIPGNSTLEITAFQFTGSDTGYALRQYPYKTVDGGVTWFPLSSGNNVFRDFHFIDNLAGAFAGENVIAYTNDGGINFNIQNINGGFLSIHCVNEFYCYSTGYRGLISKTSDGGTNWYNVKENSSTDILRAIDVKDNIGITVGSNTILKSIDNGENWTQITGLNLPTLYNIKIVNSQNLLLGSHYIYQSFDTGSTWINVTPTINTDFNAFSFISADTGFVAGIGYLLKTTDGGSNWITVNNTTFNDISFLNSNIGYAINNQLHKSIDGGISWNTIPFTGLLKQLKFTSIDTGYIAVQNGLAGETLLRTVDGGQNWLPVYYYPVTSMHFIDNDTGFVLFNNNVFVTTDAGNTWNALSYNPAVGSNFEAIYFTDSNAGYIAGSYNYLLKYQGSGVGTSIDENSINSIISVYPNPTNNKINISLNIKNNSFVNFYLYNISGMLMKEIKLPKQGSDKLDIVVNTENYLNGIYVIKVEMENQVFTEKLIINR